MVNRSHKNILVFLIFTFFLSLFPIRNSLFASDVPGKLLYEQKCSQCHGPSGRGDGPAAPYVDPKPRDFTEGKFKIRTTESGNLPTDKDLVNIISNGIPGTSMPSFENFLSNSEINELISYIKSLYPGFEDEDPEPVKIGGATKTSNEAIEKGKEYYKKFGCAKCHGTEGRADGPSSPTLKDEKGNPVLPADLTKPWRFRGGMEAKDIFTRLTTGLSGTPMPAFVGLMPDEEEDAKARWELAHYVKSLSAGRPNIQSVIEAKSYPGEIPISFDQPAENIWNGVGEIDIPLVGQIIIEPRLFIPSIDMVSVSALYNERDLVLRIRWNDRTNISGKPDFLSIQLPLKKPDGSVLPYFLGGNSAKPVKILTWISDNDKMIAQIFRGLHTSEDTSTETEIKSNFSEGQWTILVKIPLDSKDSGNHFKVGKFSPVAFHAGDGSNSEGGSKRSVSSWVHILLSPEPPKARFVWPVVAFAGTFGLEFLLLGWIRKRRNIS